MSKKFNLLLLHEDWDTHPRSWVCFKGQQLGLTVAGLEEDILRKTGLTREELSRQFGNELGCSHYVIKRILQRKNYFPIVVLNKLLEYSKHKNKLLKRINLQVQLIKINGGSAKPVKACKDLTKDLAKFLGAFMADGSLHITIVFAAKNQKDLSDLKQRIHNTKIRYSESYSTARREFYIACVPNRFNYEDLKALSKEFSKRIFVQTHANIELTDYYRENVEKFNEWVFTSFGLKPLKFRKRGNAWRTYFCNKILLRYLTAFFEVKPSKKADIACEPPAIRNSVFGIRKEFAKGVLMFDGCATLDGRITLQSNSPFLVQSIADIWSKDGIEFGVTKNGLVIYSILGNPVKKLLCYFEAKTPKYDRLRMVDGSAKIESRLDSKSETVSLKEIFETIKKVKICDVEFVMNKFSIRRNTATVYLKILERNNKIKLTLKPDFLDPAFVNPTTGLALENQSRDSLFKKLKTKFGSYKDAANFLGVRKASFSAWKTGKNRIPIKIIEQLIKVSNVEGSELYTGIISTDRIICSLP